MYKIEITLDLPESQNTALIHDVLRVDKEPKSTVTKCFNLENNKLSVTFSSESAKSLRVAVNGFFENVNLIVETIDSFGKNA